MTHPDELFESAKRKVEENQHESCVANAQARYFRHWLAERVRKWADRLDAAYPEELELPVVRR